jgi:hypothetical protein
MTAEMELAIALLAFADALLALGLLLAAWTD